MPTSIPTALVLPVIGGLVAALGIVWHAFRSERQARDEERRARDNLVNHLVAEQARTIEAFRTIAQFSAGDS